MYRSTFFLSLVLFLFASYGSLALAADTVLFSPNSDPRELQGDNRSRVSSIPPSASRNTPSGQGPQMQSGAMPSSGPLYVPGQTQNTARPLTGAPAWAQQAYPTSPNTFPPFGANLFQGYFAGTYSEGLNNSYVIMPGDRILVHIWGAQSFNETLMVDQQGNIFLPEVGPIRVAGITNGALTSTVRQQISSVFKTNVELYTNLLTAQPVAIYVTGFVNRPGRYAGGSSDGPLYYLDKAGGIIPERGSYRNISIQRKGKTIDKLDLYSFLLHGSLPNKQLRDGDVIIVGPKGGSIIAYGLIPQHARYEYTSNGLSGSDLIKYAAPLPATSHVSVSGTRNTRPFHVYLPLHEFSTFQLAAEDKVEFLADKAGESIMVSVSGSTLGATRYPVKRNTTLRTLLAHVSIDSQLSNLSGIYLKRRSTAEQQKKAIADALHRLESTILTAPSATNEEARIRVQEAELIQNFVQRASQLEPDGVVVVTKNGHTADIILEEGDEIVIPQRSDVVQIVGEVMIPKAVIYNEKMSLKEYIQNAGGFTERADKSNILVVHPNGEVVQAKSTTLQPGDQLMVMPDYDAKSFQLFREILQAVYQLAVSTKVILSL